MSVPEVSTEKVEQTTSAFTSPVDEQKKQEQHLNDLLDMLHNPTAEQLEKMKQLHAKVTPIAAQLSPAMRNAFNTYRAVFLARHLIARKWVVDDALSMVQDAAAWRNSNGIDQEPLFPNPSIILRGYDMDEMVKIRGCGVKKEATNRIDGIVEQLRMVSSECYHKWDRNGRPVYISRVVRDSFIPEFWARMKSISPPGANPGQVVCDAHVYANETGACAVSYCNKNIVPNLPRKEGEKPATPNTCITAIFDCADLTMSHLGLLKLLEIQSALDKKFYAEGLGSAIIVNCGAAVRAAWVLMAVFVDERTKNKVKFYAPGEDSKKALLEAIAPENLPEFLGGACKCEGGCCPAPGAGFTAENAPKLGPTREINIAAGKTETYTEENVKKGDAVNVHVHIAALDILFSAAFRSAAAAAGEEAKPLGGAPTKIVAAGDDGGQLKVTFTAPDDGKIVFSLDNSYSWVRGKTVSILVQVERSS